MASPSAINKILCDMRAAINQGKFIPIERDKNLRSIIKTGLTWKIIKSEIYTLTPAEYHAGPKVDRDDPASDFFWEFKKVIDGQIFYIKFKVLYQENGELKVVGFHIDYAD